MFFLLSQVLDILVMPSNVIAMLGSLGLALLLFRKRRPAIIAFACSALLLLVTGALPTGATALALLENRFPEPQLTTDVTGIIMLGGAVDTHITSDRQSPSLNDAAERLTATRSPSVTPPRALSCLEAEVTLVPTRS